MRYYQIKLTNPAGAVVTFNDAAGKFVPTPGALWTWSSHDRTGNVDPGALQVVLDVPSLPFGALQGGLAVQIWGVGLAALGQGNDLAGYGIEIQGGMKPPYTLNQAAKPGVLAVGQVFQGYGNWEGLEQHLDLIVFSQATNPDLQAAIPFNWQKNQPLDQAVANALTAAFPTFTVQTQGVVKSIIQDHDEVGYYSDAKAFAEFVLEVSQSGTYTGINIRAVGSVFYLYDNSVPSTPLQVQFPDLIGQPTWISPSVMAFSSVMRADIGLGQAIQMPSGLVPPYSLTTPAAAVPNAPASNRSQFQGQFNIIEVHHYGNSRDVSAESWRTEFVAVVNNAIPNQIAGDPTLTPGLA